MVLKMAVISKEGYFENGAYHKGLYPSMIGKQMVRTQKCVCGGPAGHYDDYSYSVNGLYGPMDPEHEQVTLLAINPDGSLEVKWKSYFPHLEPYWNDGNWIEYTG
jgi:hypothetical protein